MQKMQIIYAPLISHNIKNKDLMKSIATLKDAVDELPKVPRAMKSVFKVGQ